MKINFEFFIYNARELSVNIKDLPASTLGQTWENPVLEPLAVPASTANPTLDKRNGINFVPQLCQS